MAWSSLARHVDAARLFETAARRFRNRTAVVGEGEALTYGHLLERTGRVAAALEAIGVRRGERVALVLPNGVGFIETWWGVVRAGAVVVPLNPTAPFEELVRFLDKAEASALIARSGLLEGDAGPVRQRLPGMRVIGVGAPRAAEAIDLDELLAATDPLDEAEALGLDEPCAIYWTAGSTGQPKGVVRSQQSIVWGLSMLAQRMSPDDVLLARAPMAHTGGSLTGPFAVLIAGGVLALPTASSAEAVLRAVERHGVTHLYVHPTVFAKGMFAALEAKDFDLRSLKRLQWTAGALPEPVRASLFERFPELPLEVTFGMTEASNIASFTYAPGSRMPPQPASCVGYPLPGAEIRIVDEKGQALAAGEEGEIAIRTPTAFDGYWRDDEATAAAITPDGWLRTGDIGLLDADGALHLKGRRREIIKSGGMTVHPAEVEQVLADHPHVVDVVVFGRAHSKWDEAVTAAVSLRACGSVATAEQLIAHCRSRLASYKLPKAVHVLAELPRNGSGKVDRHRVIAQLTLPDNAD